MKGFLECLVLCFFGMTICRAGEEVVRVATAANLTPLTEALGEAFTEASDHKYRAAFAIGSTGALTAKILNGAPFDVFLSADKAHAEKIFADQKGKEPPKVYVRGILVLAASKEAGEFQFTEEGFRLKNGEIKKVALANPDLAPYGKAAKELIARKGWNTLLDSKSVMGNNVGQTLQFLKSGTVEAAFVAKSQVMAAEDLIYREFALEDYSPVEQAVLLLSPDSPGARAFYVFLFSDRARRMFRDAGYALNGDVHD